MFQTELEDARGELVRTKQSVDPLIKAVRESKSGRQAALVKARRLDRCLDKKCSGCYVAMKRGRA